MALAEESRKTHLTERVWPGLGGRPKQRYHTLWLALWLIPCAGESAELPPNEIVRRAFAAEEQNDKIARDYTFHERSEQRSFDKKGGLKSSRSKTHDLTILDGSVYRRLIARNDRVLELQEEKKQQQKLEKSIACMRKETPRQRKKRLANQEKKKTDEREFVAEVQRAYDFQLVGEDCVDGIETYVIDAEPKPGYKPANKRARILSKLRGIFWIAKDDYGWVKLEAETIEKVSFGLFLFKLNKGAKLRFEKTRVNDEVWLVDTFRVRFKARLGLIKGFNSEFLSTFSNFRKFTATSRVVSVAELSEDPSPL